jgi:hypothetical protein
MTSPPVHHEARATEAQAAEVRATEAGGTGE